MQNIGFWGNRRRFRLPRLVRGPTPKSGEVRHRRTVDVSILLVVVVDGEYLFALLEIYSAY